MGGDRGQVGENAEKVIVNIGCGYRKMEDAINVDAFQNCNPDILWDLNRAPWPFDDESVDMVHAHHIMEHLDNWWDAVKETARILKLGGVLEMSVPDYNTTEDMGYIDHKHIITKYSFHLILGQEQRGANAWARQEGRVPLMMTQYVRVVKDRYVKWWVPKSILRFCTEHMTNFVHEQRFSFIKI
jgi:SAM-dependent methyltransferase